MSNAIEDICKSCMKAIADGMETHKEVIDTMDATSLLVGLMVNIMGNLIINSVNPDFPLEQKHKSSQLLLQAVGGQVQANLDRIFDSPESAQIEEDMKH